MVTEHAIVRGLVLDGNRSPVAMTQPVIIARTDKQFIPGLLQDLSNSPATLSSSLAQTRDSSGVLKLFQPVHRVFQIAVLQMDCDSFGAPRLDPTKIDSLGLVVRRISVDTPNTIERWSKQDSKIAGWVSCTDAELDMDPDPARRRPVATSGNAIIDQHLPVPSSGYAPYSESFAPLFVAPPQLCKQIKATVLYGLIPVTSVEKSEVIPPPSYDPTMVQQHMPYFLQLSTSPVQSSSLALANRVVTYSSATDTFTSSDPDADQSTVPDALTSLINILRQLEFELNAFSDNFSDGVALFQALNQFTVQDSNGNVLANLGDFLKGAAKILVDKQDGSIQMPDQWPRITDDQSTSIALLFQNAMESRVKDLIAGEARYEVQDPPRQYRLRAFVRIKRPDGCPPVLLWSAPSEPFTIAPWYDSAGLPPVKITLPGIATLKNLKPNVAFAMPPELFNVLQKDAKKTLKGQDSSGGGLGIAWICAFSIPIITICAFIVLNIFLSLFDLFFQWMLFIKICLPIPVPKKKRP
ncbi:MAG: hypothetical protein DMG54_17400 [Acidobacteria bacterium]|nr:MAG: hypothetical protein DMG54_17400 [Acidobacteriota bacterium]